MGGNHRAKERQPRPGSPTAPLGARREHAGPLPAGTWLLAFLKGLSPGVRQPGQAERTGLGLRGGLELHCLHGGAAGLCQAPWGSFGHPTHMPSLTSTRWAKGQGLHCSPSQVRVWLRGFHRCLHLFRPQFPHLKSQLCVGAGRVEESMQVNQDRSLREAVLWPLSAPPLEGQGREGGAQAPPSPTATNPQSNALPPPPTRKVAAWGLCPSGAGCFHQPRDPQTLLRNG